MPPVIRKSVSTIRVDIYIGGDLAQAKQVCREYCMVGLCVHVEPVDFIYTGGEEAGCKIGLINYPRFPASESDLLRHAGVLAEMLVARLYQHSYCIVGPTNTLWFSRREHD